MLHFVWSQNGCELQTSRVHSEPGLIAFIVEPQSVLLPFKAVIHEAVEYWQLDYMFWDVPANTRPGTTCELDAIQSNKNEVLGYMLSDLLCGSRG